MKSQILITALVGASLTPSFAQAPANRLTIDTARPGVKVSPLLYGILFEEINRAGDGGIYAEMLQNRSFEDNDEFPVAWKSKNAKLSLDKSLAINPNNPTSLRVESQAGGSLSNGGFVGTPMDRRYPRKAPQGWQQRIENEPDQLAVQNGKQYDLSLYVRSENSISLTASIQSADGKTLASQQIPNVGRAWKKVALTLTATATDANARLVISSQQQGTYWLDMVSLFPRDTWKGRKNGLRSDLMEKIAAMHPSFVRFPGGCYVEGYERENRAQWKHSVGDVETRPSQWGNWEYNSTNGLGYHEYLQMWEDLGADPLFVINVGIGHSAAGNYFVPMNEMGPFVQDALDAIEYANGPVTSKWGAMRAKAGHPKPFNLKMMEIGNENAGREYDERYALFHDAIKAKYPNFQMIANVITPNRKNDVFDPHMYDSTPTFLRDAARFDNQDRSGPQVYFGEYAVTVDCGEGNLNAALGEAAFMTGLERNGDIVKMSSYAPLLTRTGWKTWNPNAIPFDQSRVYGTPSYYVQAMFAANRSDQILPVDLQMPSVAALPLKGKIGVGTWGGAAEFKDIKVVKGDQTLYQSDFATGLGTLKAVRGQWTTENGALKQTSDQLNTLAMVGETDWSDYTLSLKARKLGGPEGFLITFAAQNEGEKSWWNLGGWGNNEYGIEMSGLSVPHVPGHIESDRWYDIKIELKGASAKLYLDGQLIHEVMGTPLPVFAAVAGLDQKTGETILKFVNASNENRTVKLDLNGAKPGKIAGQAWVLTSANGRDENSFDAPDKIAPRTEALSADTADFTRTFPANSVSVLRWK